MNALSTIKGVRIMSILSLVTAAPAICGQPDPERLAWIAKAVWDEEISNENSVFALKPSDVEEPGRRIRPLVSWINTEEGGVEEFIWKLLILANNSHRIIEHGDVQLQDGSVVLENWLREREDQYPAVSAHLTVNQVILGIWF